jgi:hypothetical protein
MIFPENEESPPIKRGIRFTNPSYIFSCESYLHFFEFPEPLAKSFGETAHVGTPSLGKTKN